MNGNVVERGRRVGGITPDPKNLDPIVAVRPG
jgi:hypothetical protein